MAEPVRPEITQHTPAVTPGRARRLYLILGMAVVVALLAYGVYALLSSSKETTDDAQVAADVVAVAPRVPGQIVRVYVRENEEVRAGAPIVELDPRDAQVRVAQAESELATAQAQAQAAEARLSVTRSSAHGGATAAQAAVQSSRSRVSGTESAIAEARAAIARAEATAQKARLDWGRAQELGAKGNISKAQVDAARASTDAAEADLEQARARLRTSEESRSMARSEVGAAVGRLEQTSPEAQIHAAEADAALARARVTTAAAALSAARLNLSYTRVVAPRDGLAARLAVHEGSLVTAGQPVVQLVPLQTYVIANFKETQVRAMRAGERATIKVDAMDGAFEGSVESLSGGTGATFSLLPPDNASGNYVKVVQRVPVRIRWNGPAANRIPVGASAEVTVFTK